MIPLTHTFRLPFSPFISRVLLVSWFCLSSATANTNVEWHLDSTASELSYLSIKMSGQKSIVEPNRFKKIHGVLEKETAWVEIDLNSIDTRVAIRDQRVLTHVFQVTDHPLVRVSVANVFAPEIGIVRKETLQTKIRMRGKDVIVPVTVIVTRLRRDELLVQTAEPLLLDATQWGMAAGFETLREMVKLTHISTTVPISFRLLFRQAQ